MIQNWKTKTKTGDRLLPLAAEEESSFPTLQEVEEMSNQQIKLAHGHRPPPKADNSVWRTETNETTVESPIDEINVAIELTSIPDNNSNNSLDANPTPTQSYIGHKIPDEFLIKAGLVGDDTEEGDHVEPHYKLNADGSICGK